MRITHSLISLAFGCLVSGSLFATWDVPDAVCSSYEAWQIQWNPRTDPNGFRNSAYPEASATYWSTVLDQPLGTEVVITGRFPQARYMAIQVYDEQRNVMGAINDAQINPDAGQNNPFRTDSAQGTYTVRVVFGRKPFRPAPNTVYTANLTNVMIVYRIYYSNNPDDLTGGVDLPVVTLGGRALSNCPPRPIIRPEELTVWGRLDDSDWAGTDSSSLNGATNPPKWVLSVTNRFTPYYPSADNSYMSASISRAFLKAPHNNDMVVFRFRAPSFANTQAGEPPYLAVQDRQVRFWSVCQDEPITTGVVRCVPDNEAAIKDGFATFVISDPSKRPSPEVLAQHGASWLPWGALQGTDQVYDIEGNLVGNNESAFFNGLILYRQTVPNPNFSQGMAAVGQLPRSEWRSAMGDYWPTIGYCTSAAFESLGSGCIKK